MKSIPLASFKPRKQTSRPRDLVALIDDDDFELASRYKWHPSRGAKNKTWYAKSGSLYLHRLILGLRKGDGIEVDHKDGNGLNCQRSNLRTGTSSQNKANTPSRVAGKMKGVRFKAGRWEAAIRADGRRQYLGRFGTEREAILAYNAKAKQVFGEFAYQNPIPEDRERRAS